MRGTMSFCTGDQEGECQVMPSPDQTRGNPAESSTELGQTRSRLKAAPSWLLGVMLLLVGCRGVSRQPAQYPVLHLPMRDWPAGYTLEQLKDLPMPELVQVDGLNLVNETGEIQRVTTWRAYDRASKAGYHCSDDASLRLSSWLEVRGGILQFLERAQPSRTSYVRDLRMGSDLLRQLPATLGLLVSGEQIEAARAAAQTGKPWSDFFPAMKIKRRTRTTMQLEGGGDSAYLRFVAYGDFDHDGVEDLLLYLAYQATEGTMSYACTAILTRASRMEPLRVVTLLPSH